MVEIFVIAIILLQVAQLDDLQNVCDIMACAYRITFPHFYYNAACDVQLDI